MSSSAVNAYRVKDIDGAWPSVVFMIRTALREGHGEYTPDSILTSLKNGELTLWIAPDETGRILGIAVLRIAVYSEYKVAFVTLSAGSQMGRWLHNLTSVLEPYAISLGCREMRVSGRKGWERALKDQGWSFRSVVVGKVLERREASRPDDGERQWATTAAPNT